MWCRYELPWHILYRVTHEDWGDFVRHGTFYHAESFYQRALYADKQVCVCLGQWCEALTTQTRWFRESALG